MAWVTINGTKYYQLKKTVGHRINDNGIEVPVIKYFRAHTKKEAEAKYQDFLSQKIQVDNKKRYFGIEAEKWIENSFWYSEHSDRTKQLYTRAWEKYIKPQSFYNLPLSDVTCEVVQQGYNSIMEQPSSTPSGLRSANKLLALFYNYLQQNNLAIDFTSSLKYPKRDCSMQNDDITTWSDEEYNLIFNNFEKSKFSKRIRFLLVLARYTGCRISELLAIRYADITSEGIKINKQAQVIYKKDAEGNRVPVISIDYTKNKKGRTLPIHPEIEKELQLHKAWHLKEAKKNRYNPEYIFTTSNGTLYNRANIDHTTRKYYKDIGITEPKGFHTYRHTFATNLCKQGVQLQTTAKLLGDTLAVAGRYYVKVEQDTMQKAILML